MRTLSHIILISTLLAMPSYVSANDGAKIERLELQVKQLTEELQRVRTQYITLQTQLDSVRDILGEKVDIALKDDEDIDKQLCLSKLMDAKNTLAKLKNLGYTAQHPDSVNVRRNAESLMLECGQSSGDSSGN